MWCNLWASINKPADWMHAVHTLKNWTLSENQPPVKQCFREPSQTHSPPCRLGDRVHAPSHPQPHFFFFENNVSNVQWAKENWPVRMCSWWCRMNALLVSVPSIVNRLQQEGIFVLFPNCFSLFHSLSYFLIQWFLSPFSLTLLLLDLSETQRLCESVSYENMCKCCWFSQRQILRDDTLYKNTCPLDLTSSLPRILV